YMYPVERATRSGLVGPWRTPETHFSAGLNPGNIEPWGITNFQLFPNLEILIYHGWYLLYRYWPTSHNTHKFEAYNAFHPATTVR
ncbi:(2Fe-2S)-binding protein, partial [Mycobacterium sp. ITM-2017-0098]